MNSSTATERLIAAIVHLVALLALVPYFVGMTLIPSGPIWIGGLAVCVGTALFSWKHSSFVSRHSLQAILALLAGFLPELIGVLAFVVVTLLGIGIDMRTGTLQDGIFAGYNLERLITVALAPVILAIPCWCAYRAYSGKECQVPLLGPLVGRILSAALREGRP